MSIRPYRFAFAGFGIALTAALVVVGGASSASAAPGDANFLDRATPFSVLAHTTVTNSGVSTHLDRGVALSLGLSTPGLTAGMVAGSTNLGDQVAIDAQTDVTTAANALMAAPNFNVGAVDLVGNTYLAGSYSSATALNNTGVMTLQGDEDDVFIFTAVSDLNFGVGASIDFVGGAQACNLFWRIGSSTAIGTSAAFAGTLISGSLVAVGTDATIDGRLFSQTDAVTLLNNVFTSSACVTGVGDGSRTGGTTLPSAPTSTAANAAAAAAAAASAAAASAAALLAATGAEDNGRPALVALFIMLAGVILITTAALRRRRLDLDSASNS